MVYLLNYVQDGLFVFFDFGFWLLFERRAIVDLRFLLSAFFFGVFFAFFLDNLTTFFFDFLCIHAHLLQEA